MDSNPSTEKGSWARRGWIALAIAVVALVVGAFAIASPVLQAPPAADRVVYVLAVEYKGTAGPGERLSNGTKVSAYQWDPATIIVNRGDRVTLKIYGVNGAAHPSSIEGYADLTYKVIDPSGSVIEEGAKTFDVYRGHWTEVRFVASKAGVFTIGCGVHQPTMNALLHVVG